MCEWPHYSVGLAALLDGLIYAECLTIHHSSQGSNKRSSCSLDCTAIALRLWRLCFLACLCSLALFLQRTRSRQRLNLAAARFCMS